MLTGSSLSNDSLLPKPLGKQSLGDCIVNLVGPSMVEILPLEVNMRPFTVWAPVVLSKSLCKIKRALPTNVVPQNAVKFFLQIYIDSVIDSRGKSQGGGKKG